MQLKKIKLSGFKSFVDPTTVPIPSNLVAVVGPNGCGKSNIIDAVCWVMGESSAKYLRGESLTDVIFNGSTSRKPVGQASVELIFDNQDGSLGGEYGSYAEISIRRVINRDSESSYFLNGTRCRRRDVIDIFLGTGLGPRSYSIIGQNMISRLIEAKPDDMRTYLEEAAGISKYKERRRETENRIQHTKENLDRLNDVRAELEKQLNSLQRQANAAEKYKELKQEERILRAKWLAAQWRHLDAKLVQYTLQIQQHETGLEAHQASLGEANLTIEKRREDQHLSNEAFQEVQKRFYAVGNEIARIEQDILHTKERQRQWQTDVEQAGKNWQEVKDSIEEIEDEMQELAQEIEELEPQTHDAAETATQAATAYQTAELAVQSWQSRSDEFNQHAARTTQTAEVEQTRMTHLEQRMSSIKQRQMKLEQDQARIDFSQLEKEIETFVEQLAEFRELSSEHQQQLADVRQQLTTLQHQQQQTVTQLDQVRNNLQKMRGQQASLEALQQTALGQRNHVISAWLAKHQLDKLPRLAQEVEVQAGWEVAAEKVLGTHLQAICVDDFAQSLDAIQELTEGNVCLFAPHEQRKISDTKATLLLDKIKSDYSLTSLLTGIYAVDTLQEAVALCHSLESHESVITRDGVWVSPAWLRVTRAEDPAAGVFQREQELKQLAQQIAELSAAESELSEQLEQIRADLQTLESKRDDLQKLANQSHADVVQVEAQQKMKQTRLIELKNLADKLRQEQEESAEQYSEAHEALASAKSIWQQAMAELETLADQRDELAAERDTLRDAQHQHRQAMHESKELVHQLEIRLQTAKSQQGSTKQSIARMQTQLTSLAERKAQLANEEYAGTPIAELESTLSNGLSRRLQIEDELSKARAIIETIEQEIRQLDDRRHSEEREIAKIRDMLETSRLESQGFKVKCETLLEQLTETHFTLEDILRELPEEVSAAECQEQLEQVTQRITRLGAINLVAIEEYASCSERKIYLDKQYADLQEGLTTLENAIAKIDKETRARFKETFDKVNDRFQELFPQIFGGGRAYMELTGDNLLDAGVTVMACPPGKRNSTIHLLSGGEKAMTAIALVFSIFHLNPAPFCLLDEVDAPLDDANIGRFCQLVKTMAERTQFIFISHNKLAIEMGEHLMGVTMHEPGVSRLVSVNVEEAVNLAGA